MQTNVDDMRRDLCKVFTAELCASMRNEQFLLLVHKYPGDVASAILEEARSGAYHSTHASAEQACSKLKNIVNSPTSVDQLRITPVLNTLGITDPALRKDIVRAAFSILLRDPAVVNFVQSVDRVTSVYTMFGNPGVLRHLDD